MTDEKEIDDELYHLMLNLALNIVNFSNKVYPAIFSKIESLKNTGWFLGCIGSTSELLELKNNFEKINNDDELNSFMFKTYKDNFDYYCEEILNEIPERGFSINPAINSHKNGDYVLSIPIFIAEADGHLYRKTNKNLFTSSDGIRKTAEKYHANAKHNMERVGFKKSLKELNWILLKDELPIQLGKDKRNDKTLGGINRGLIMHGLYEESHIREINSFKAFSLLHSIIKTTKNLDEEAVEFLSEKKI